MINANQLQIKIEQQEKIELFINGRLLNGPYSGKSIRITDKDEVGAIHGNKSYVTKLLSEHGYTLIHNESKRLDGGFGDTIPDSFTIEW